MHGLFTARPGRVAPAARLHRLWFVPVLAMVGALLPAVTAFAGPVHPAGSTTVVLTLAPHQPSLLRRLAQRRHAGFAARRDALRAAGPTRLMHGRVTGWLAAHGFRVTHTDTWTVTATAPSATARGALAHGKVPAALGGAVTAVVGVGRAHRFHPRSLRAVTPTELSAAYARPAGAAGAGATVATLQFSGWPGLADPTSGDLARWARAAGVPLPPITAIGVDGADPTVADGNGGTEVALDQEALLATAPAAAQRVYVTGNDPVGEVEAWGRILSDVQAGTPITAVSTSWGACEQEMGQQELAAVEQDLTALNALGVSVFAASGDTSAYDCPDGVLPAGTPSVDYPASSPEVIGVGGTTLTGSNGAYTETAWGATAVDDQPGTGSGGGVSTLFSRPAWQRSVRPDLPARRLVPDIASDADPATGLVIIDGGTWYRAGGTSLAAPTQAGLYAAALAAAGHPAGTATDYHTVLYTAPAGDFRDITSGTNHVYAAAPGYDPVTGLGSVQWARLEPPSGSVSVSAPPASRSATVKVAVTAFGGFTPSGWAAGQTGTVSCADATASAVPTRVTLPAGPDRATSITVYGRRADGTCVSATAPVVLDRADPAATASVTSLTRHDRRLRVSWGGHDPAPGSGVNRYTVTLQAISGHHRYTVWVRHFPRARAVVLRRPWRTAYRAVVRVTDAAGNTSPAAVSAWRAVPLGARRLHHSRGWRLTRNRRAYARRFLITSRRGQTITARVTGRRLTLLVIRSAHSGKFAVYVDGHRRRTVDLYAVRPRWNQRIVVARWSTSRTHRIVLRVLGKHRRRARGSRVRIDALRVHP